MFKQVEFKPNRYNEITIDNTLVPMSNTMISIYGVLTANDYILYSLDGEIISKGRRPYLTKKRDIEWHKIFKMWKRKSRSIMYSRYWKYLPSRIAYYLSTSD